jgi:hypothetical protein
MKFRTCVEPREPMRGLEVPPEIVESLGQGKRPRVIIAINGHSWKSRIAIMRGPFSARLEQRQPASRRCGDRRRGRGHAGV